MATWEVNDFLFIFEGRLERSGPLRGLCLWGGGGGGGGEVADKRVKGGWGKETKIFTDIP
jgi:hypothetical protein